MLLAASHAWRNKLDDNSINLNTRDEIIGTSQSEKLLGGLINQNLKWTDHIIINEESLLKKLGTRLNALKQIGKFSDFRTVCKWTIYEQTHLPYPPLGWV
jgi:hypothetical protein